MGLIFVPCEICGKDDWEIRFPSTILSENGLNPDVFRCTSSYFGSHPQIVQCNHCGHVYTNPRWTDEELLEAYSIVQDDIYEEEREGRELTFDRHLDHLEKLIGAGNGRKLLDVGAYIGVFVEVASEAGWDAQGIEPSTWAVQVAKQRGIKVNRGTLEYPVFQESQFDVITMWDVIEHLPRPKADTAKAFDLLKPGGHLVIHTMDIDSQTARLMGKRWPWLMDMHLHYFSKESLGRMLQDSGYELIWSGAQGRYLRVGYLASRLGGMSQSIGRIAYKASEITRLNKRAIPVNFGDLFTVYARKPIQN